MKLSQDRLKQLLHYAPATGVFKWRVTRRVPAGSVAGSIDSSGHRQIKIDGRCYGAHRLAWLYVRGRWPSSQIDHRNGLRDDNRLDNLREATALINAWNRHKVRSDSATGQLGVGAIGPRFRARIAVNGRRLYLGCFDTADAAAAAYRAAKALHHAAATP